MGSLLASECPTSEGPFASKLVSHSLSTGPLWEACWQANAPASKGPFASELVSHSLATGPLWEACWQANAPRRKGRFASELVSHSLSTGPCGKLACKRMPHVGRAVRQRAGLPQPFYRPAVGSLLASECPTSEGPFASELVSHSLSTGPCGKLACKRMPLRRKGRSPASWSPTAFPEARCGKLACKRMPRVGRAVRQRVGLPQPFQRPAVGSLLASECPASEGPFASELVSRSLSRGPPWEACLQANSFYRA